MRGGGERPSPANTLTSMPEHGRSRPRGSDLGWRQLGGALGKRAVSTHTRITLIPGKQTACPHAAAPSEGASRGEDSQVHQLRACANRWDGTAAGGPAGTSRRASDKHRASDAERRRRGRRRRRRRWRACRRRGRAMLGPPAGQGGRGDTRRGGGVASGGCRRETSTSSGGSAAAAARQPDHRWGCSPPGDVGKDVVCTVLHMYVHCTRVARRWRVGRGKGQSGRAVLQSCGFVAEARLFHLSRGGGRKWRLGIVICELTGPRRAHVPHPAPPIGSTGESSDPQRLPFTRLWPGSVPMVGMKYQAPSGQQPRRKCPLFNGFLSWRTRRDATRGAFSREVCVPRCRELHQGSVPPPRRHGPGPPTDLEGHHTGGSAVQRPIPHRLVTRGCVPATPGRCDVLLPPTPPRLAGLWARPHDLLCHSPLPFLSSLSTPPSSPPRSRAPPLPFPPCRLCRHQHLLQRRH